ncbi:MAG: hypothetical protein KDK96_06660 [Chlamydiia bacterium]|nr:hypothetical protein [Chlamydiia bacterium]
MSTLHCDFRILSNCYSSFESLTGSNLPLAHVYYQKGQLRREILSEDRFQHLIYGILNGIGETFLRTAELNRKMFAVQGGKVPMVISETIRVTALARINDLECRLLKRSSAINERLLARIELVKEGEAFLHSYLGEEVIFETSYTKEDVERWKRKHLEEIFGVDLPERFPNIDQFERLIRQKFSMEDEQRLKYWEEKVVNGSFRIVQYPDVGDLVCYLDCSPFVEGTVDESAKIDVKGELHTLFEKGEYGKKVLFLRRKTDPPLEGPSK